ncbi:MULTISPECIES: YlaH-like family protein [Sinobaca]|uniref:YlaH-like protein n=1 Tax=Sinobaca qinghaiensis TaxID=342944 RepID=A0A419V6A8_9BACL|nr:MULTISPECIES: YlaH-like family protein [Sinobaca]RKD75500.1 YlaH-like protein [Sinobaca qinghaiensis]
MNGGSTNSGDIAVTQDQLSWTAGMLGIHEYPITGFWLLYAAVVIMCILVFNMGFARKLPLLKNVIVYSALLIGALPLTIFAIGMAVVESLFAAAVVLAIYRLRLKRHKQEQNQQPSA